MADYERTIEWIGEPLLYRRRDGGHGLVTGRYQYLFDAAGRMENMSQVSRPVLTILLDSLYPGEGNAALIAAANLRPVQSITDEG